MRATDSRNVSSPRMTMALSQLKNGLSLINGEPPVNNAERICNSVRYKWFKGNNKG